MVRSFLVVALALAGLLALLQVAKAQSPSCKEFRDSIVNMEGESVRPPGWLSLDSYLRLIYDAYCVQDPTPERPTEYWYRADGTSTGVPVSQGRPADGAYATTQEIGDFCLGLAGEMIRNEQGRTLRAGMDPSICALLQAGTRGKPPAVPADPLPPIPVDLDGGPYNIDPQCLGVLNQFGNDLALDDQRAGQRPAWLATLRGHCPDFLAAIERRTGAGAEADPDRFWQDFGQLLMTGFGPPGQQQMSVADIAADAGWQRMCQQAEANMNQCALSQANMRSLGTEPMGTTSQAGAFNQCRILYGQVVGMCKGTTGAAMRAAGAKEQQGAGPQMSAQCQQLVSSYVAAAQEGDGPKAVAAHNALKQAGGCGVLDKVAVQQAPPAGDSRFVSRGSRPYLNSTVVPCDQNPAACSAAVDRLRQGTSPEATAAMYANAISIGLQIGALMGQGVLMMQYSNMQRGSSGGGGDSGQQAGAAPPPRGSIPHPQGGPANQSGISGSTR